MPAPDLELGWWTDWRGGDGRRVRPPRGRPVTTRRAVRCSTTTPPTRCGSSSGRASRDLRAGAGAGALACTVAKETTSGCSPTPWSPCRSSSCSSAAGCSVCTPPALPRRPRPRACGDERRRQVDAHPGLARAGFGFLGDDTLFLARRPEGLRLLAFPDEVDLTDETVSFFPDLAPWLAAPRSGWRKRQLRAEEACGAEVVWECAPSHLVFPHVSGRQESALIRVGADGALLELVPNVLLTEPASSQAHLDALADLAAASSCWRLETGRDLDGAVRLLAALFPPRILP